MTGFDLLERAATIAAAIVALVSRVQRILVLVNRVLPPAMPAVSYENLRLDLVLDIQDAAGTRAVLERRQHIRFLTRDAGVVRELVWGEGNPLVRYTTRGADRLGVQQDGSRRVVLLGVGQRAVRGTRAQFHSRRVISDGLTASTEYCEVAVERPTAQLSLRVVFPPDRPPRETYLVASGGGASRRLPIRYGADGRAVVSWRMTRPVPDRTYSVRWAW